VNAVPLEVHPVADALRGQEERRRRREIVHEWPVRTLDVKARSRLEMCADTMNASLCTPAATESRTRGSGERIAPNPCAAAVPTCPSSRVAMSSLPATCNTAGPWCLRAPL
jgi:hypothetical protein